MANPYVNKVEYAGQLLIDLTGDTVAASDVAQGKIFHLPSGQSAVGTSVNKYRVYDIPLPKSSGWVTLVQALDNDVLQHINDENLIVTLINMSEYEYEFYSGYLYFACNHAFGVAGNPLTFGFASRAQSDSNFAVNRICRPANSTDGSSDPTSPFGQFWLDGSSYKLRPGDGFIAPGNWRLSFFWV